MKIREEVERRQYNFIFLGHRIEAGWPMIKLMEHYVLNMFARQVVALKFPSSEQKDILIQ